MGKSFLLFGSIFAAIGAVLLAIAGIGFFSDKSRMENAQRAEGTVIALRANSGSDGSTT